MKMSSEKPLHDPSIFVLFIPAKWAFIIMEDGVWWFNFQCLKVLSMDQEKMRGASKVPISRLCFTMKVNSQHRVPVERPPHFVVSVPSRSLP